MTSDDWLIVVVDTIRVKGKPRNWMPSAESLVTQAGVPLRIARRWKRERYQITVGLRKRLKESRN